ncbi:MAG: hypothetical protein II128_06705, partial [Atopobiaceae bacterium]|nr:hypothetical protein [Atopobiaceae bacterium]
NQLEFDGVTWDELTKRQQKVLRDLISAGKKEDRFILQRDENGKARVKVSREDGKTISAVLNSLTETTKVMALLNPGVFVSNLIDRGFHQGFQNAAIWMGTQMHIGPYTSKKPPNQSDINSAANDEQMIEAYSTYRIAMLTGTELEFLDAVSGGLDGMRAWKEKRWSEMTPAQKISARVYDIQTGSNKLVKGQIKNFLNRFAQFAEVDPTQQHWFQKTPSGKTYFEERLASDPANLFIELMGGNRGEGTSFVTAQQAMNSAQQGDMAQRNVLAMMLGQICRKSPLAKFFVTTTVSRFPAYSLNVTGRMLNWVLPMSSINYVFTEKMAEYGHARAERAASKSGTDEAKRGYTDPHYELAQVHRNLREAMLVDITHLGVAATAAVLVGMAGGIQPPDDEKKWGNVDEWLVCGLRVGDAWWIQDILGAALPVAAFTKSAMEGKPRVDVLINGLRDACASNPVIKVADAVGWIMDPEGSLISDYEQDYEQYQNAKGGPPGFLDWMNANAIGFGMTWVSQFFTPSCLREWYQNAQSFERSYKRVFQTTDTGILSEAGQQGYTEWTTYADAQVRRATRRNPVLGLLADLILHPTTGYMAGEMPMTVYRDDAQLASADYWSINGLEPEDQPAKILEIIMEMQSYDDMEELAHTGFFLDQETKAALSSVVWDTVHELDNWYYGLQADGSLDYYVLGNGDFKTGQKLAAQIKMDWKNQKQAWSDFYYDKVRSDALNGGMTTYNRYNTTYAKDVYGDVYATGMRPQGLLPFTSGPGTVTNPEGTAGYQNDFMTVSAVTGNPMNQRALIPTTRFTEDWPDLEYWSGNGEGSGYSQTYNNWYGGSGSQPSSGNSSGTPAYNGGTDGTYPGSTSKLPSASTPTTRTTSRRRRSGGGGSRRSGGGG